MAEPRRLSGLASAALDRITALPSGRVAVALSGGADSAACAWVAQRSGREVRALHVHHGLPDSDRLAAAAASISDRLGIAFEVLVVRPQPGPGFEGRARRDRYDALLGCLGTGELLATGHTLDDQAETVLMNLVRGSGLDGVAGIPVVRLPIIRPVIEMTRSQTRELATLAGLAWRDDPANEDPAHLRNRVRREVLPALARSFNPGIAAALARTAATAASETDVLDELADRIPIETGKGEFRTPAGALLAASRPVAARALRRGLRRIGFEHPPTATQLGRVFDVAGSGGEAPLSDGVVARRKGPWLVVGVPREAPPPASVDVEIPGSARFGPVTLGFTVAERPTVMPLSTDRLVHPLAEEISVVRVRAWAPPDRIGTKRVADALAEAGVPAGDRQGWPVVELAGEVVWVPGVRRAGSPPSDADRYLCGLATEDTRWEPSAP